MKNIYLFLLLSEHVGYHLHYPISVRSAQIIEINLMDHTKMRYYKQFASRLAQVCSGKTEYSTVILTLTKIVQEHRG